MCATTGTTASTRDIGATPATGVTQPRVNKNTLFTYTHTLKPTLFNDFRIGYHRLDFDTLNQFYVNNQQGAGTALGIPGFDGDTRYNNPGLPSFNVSNFSGLSTSGTNWYQFDTTFQASDVLAWNRGSHNVRTGFDLRRLATGRRAANDPRGLFDFTGDMTGYSDGRFHAGASEDGDSADRPDSGARGRLAQRILHQRQLAGENET